MECLLPVEIVTDGICQCCLLPFESLSLSRTEETNELQEAFFDFFSDVVCYFSHLDHFLLKYLITLFLN
jgi:hypothetical protein